MGVTSRAIIFPSFAVEYAVGLRKTEKGVEVFVLRASSSIWEVEYREMHEDGRLRVIDEDGEPIPLDQNEEYQELKKRTPSDHRKIKVDQRARPIPADLAAQIDAIWHLMLAMPGNSVRRALTAMAQPITFRRRCHGEGI